MPEIHYDEMVKKIQNALKERMEKNNYHCPVCFSESIVGLPVPYHLEKHATGVPLYDQYFGVVLVKCEDCGHMDFFDLESLGILD